MQDKRQVVLIIAYSLAAIVVLSLVFVWLLTYFGGDQSIYKSGENFIETFLSEDRAKDSK